MPIAYVKRTRTRQPQEVCKIAKYLNPSQTFLYLPCISGKATRITNQGLALHGNDNYLYTANAPKTTLKKLTIVFAGGQTAACGTGNTRYFEIGGYSVGGGIGIEQVSGQESVTGWTGTWNTIGDCNFLDSDVGVNHYFVAVLNDTSLKLFRDGVKIYDGSITWDAPNTGKLALCGSSWNSGTTERVTNFQYSLFASDFGNAINDSAAINLSKNPWQIFQPIKRTLYFGMGDGGITLTLANLSQAQSIDNIGIIQQHTLSVNGLSNAQSLQNIDLVTSIVLAIADITNAQALGSIDLIQQNMLSVNASEQSQIESNIDLVQQNTLSVNASQQAQSESNIDLIQQNTLSVNASSQTQSIDPISLDTALNIEVQNIANSQSIDNISLIQQNVLSVGNLQNQQSISNIDLLQSNVLTINALLHDQSLSNISLTFNAVLSVDNILEQQSIDNISLTVANILSVYAQNQGQTLAEVILTQQSTIIVNDYLHSQLLSSVTLRDEAVPLLIRGSTVFILKHSAGPVFVLDSKSNVLINSKKANVFAK